MTARLPLYLDTSNTFVTHAYTMSSAERTAIRTQAAYEWAQNPSVTLSVVASGGTLGSMTDRRYEAGDASVNTGAGQTYEPEATTDDISAIDTTTARISSSSLGAQSNPTYTDDTIAFPAYVDASTGDIRAMSRADFLDSFIYPAINALAAGGSGVADSRAGTYIVSTLSSVTGATLVSSTPVFTDTTADAAAYTSAGIPENNDQPTTVNNYYLHEINAVVQTYPTPVYITSTGDLRQYTTAAFKTMLRNHILYETTNTTGYQLSYNINGTGNNCGTGMADTYLSGTSAAGYTTRFDAATTSYYSQEFPNGTPATRVTYYLKINQT